MLYLETITNTYRVWFLAFNFIIIYNSFLLATIFIYHAIKYEGQLIKRINFAMGIIILILGFNSITDILYPFFSEYHVDTRHFFYAIASVIIFIAVFIVEPLFRPHHTYLIPNLICCLIFIFADPDSDWIFVGIIFSVFFIILALQFFRFLTNKLGGRTRSRIRIYMVFLLITYFGSAMNVDWLVNQINQEWFPILGYIVILIGNIGVFLSLRDVEVFVEAGWKDYLEGVYIIDKATNSLIYSKLLGKNATNQTQPNELLSSGLVGIDAMMREITGLQRAQGAQGAQESSKGITSIEKDGKYILIEHLEKVLICFIATKQMESTRFFLQKIRDAWNLYYHKYTLDWAKIPSDFFLPLNSIIDRILTDNYKEGKM